MESAVSVSEFSIQVNNSIQPLLKLAGQISGLETTFITYIDPVKQIQRVIWVDGDGDIQIQAGSEVNWSDSMCRLLFNSDAIVSENVPAEFPKSAGAELGMQTFIALPVRSTQKIVGSLCAASSKQHHLPENAKYQLKLLAEAVSLHIEQWQTITELAERYEKAQKSLRKVKRETQMLSQKANTDLLTGLLNRRGFSERWAELKEAESGLVTVLAIDLDNFKPLNDEHGHAVGDQVLATFGKALRASSRSCDICARMGGDEFFWIFMNGSVKIAEEAAERLRKQFTKLTNTAIQSCAFSIGIHVEDITKGDDLLMAADKAMYQAKSQGQSLTQLTA
ncbi:GGDEF domain-containing protein [Aliidiomarina iranensis]|uniref:diguanylate cyclase n=1 Tax=Aliidiomarina iranensis TaxID=1434071 RepID=A0A432VWC0_9GAMM|nr:sensor domain-containing diguanylate cyclase [Aliidiomarina iranensis]RUO20900.1 GGDEF domain-containing protein [Aliidiomarina iranensis]